MKYASKSISGVLYSIIIYLGCQLPDTSSDLTRERGGQPHGSSIRSCSGWGLPSQTVACLLVSSYLTVPPLPGKSLAVCFCGTILRVAPTGRYPAPCPAELRLSSGIDYPRLSDLLAAIIIHESDVFNYSSSNHRMNLFLFS